MSEIMSYALESGIWATLFCFLFLYMLKDSRNREKKYTLTIESLCTHLNNLSSVLEMCQLIRDDCEDIKADAEKIKENIGRISALKENA